MILMPGWLMRIFAGRDNETNFRRDHHESYLEGYM